MSRILSHYTHQGTYHTLLVVALSKKTKKTTTPSSVVIRTNLEGWFTFTEYASTCTEIDNVIRCAMESMSEMNSSRPRCSSSGSSSSDRFLAAPSESRFESRSTSRLALVTSTTIVTKIATSSSSPICASLAAPINSLATENEMDTERSAPRLDNALDVIAPPADMMVPKTAPPPPMFRVPLAPYPAVAGTTKRVSQCVLKRAALTSQRLVDGPLLSRLDNIHAYLPVFSAFLSRRDPPPSSTGRKRRQEKGALSTTAECTGVVYGCCLGSLVAYLKVANVTTAFTVRQIEAVLQPVAASAINTRGVDSRVLCAGIASSRVLRAQLAYLTQSRLPNSLHSRNGNPSTIIGMCASVFVTFSILSSSLLGSVEAKQLERDVTWMMARRSMEQVLQVADEMAIAALPLDGWAAAPPFEIAALDAEHRAIQRARCGVEAARLFVDLHGFAPISAFRKSLDWFCRAAWPAGELLNERTHVELLQKMSSVSYYLTAVPSTPTDNASGSESIDLVPLAQLSGFAERSARSRMDSDASSVTTGSSSRTVSSSGASSAAESVLATDAEIGIDALFHVNLV